jgi:hypothetical protein
MIAHALRLQLSYLSKDQGPGGGRHHSAHSYRSGGGTEARFINRMFGIYA